MTSGAKMGPRLGPTDGPTDGLTVGGGGTRAGPTDGPAVGGGGTRAGPTLGSGGNTAGMKTGPSLGPSLGPGSGAAVVVGGGGGTTTGPTLGGGGPALGVVVVVGTSTMGGGVVDGPALAVVVGGGTSGAVTLHARARKKSGDAKREPITASTIPVDDASSVLHPLSQFAQMWPASAASAKSSATFAGLEPHSPNSGSTRQSVTPISGPETSQGMGRFGDRASSPMM